LPVRRSAGGVTLCPAARLHLFEQPHVLDRNHSLVGRGGHQLDLLVGEGLNPLARKRDHADRHLLAQQRPLNTVRLFPSPWVSGMSYSGSARISTTCTAAPSSAARPVTVAAALAVLPNLGIASDFSAIEDPRRRPRRRGSLGVLRGG